MSPKRLTIPRKTMNRTARCRGRVPLGASDGAAIASLWAMDWDFLPCDIGIRPDAGITMTRGSFALKPDALNLVLGEPLLGAVVELGRTRALMRRHFLRVFEHTAIGEVGGNPGRAKCMAPDRRGDAGRLRAAADHEPGIGLRQRPVGQRLGVVPRAGP